LILFVKDAIIISRKAKIFRQ